MTESGRHDGALPVLLFAQTGRFIERRVVAQHGISDARELVGQRAGDRVVTASALPLQRPLAHARDFVALAAGY